MGLGLFCMSFAGLLGELSCSVGALVSGISGLVLKRV